jgi:hypothetical protein
MGGIIEGFFFLVKTKQEARKTQIDPLIFMNENDNKLKKDIFAFISC